MCYNCHKFGHFEWHYFLPDRKLNKNTQQTQNKQSYRKDVCRDRDGIRDRRPNRANQAAKNKNAEYEDAFNPEHFASQPVKTAFMIRKRLRKIGVNDIGFLDSCAIYHLYNNQILFSNLKTKSINFVMVVRQVIQTEEMDNFSILLADSNNIRLQNIAQAF